MPDKAFRIFPPPTLEAEPEAIHQDINIIPQAPGREVLERPYTITNMVASADGRSALGGKASGIGSAVDRATMRNLRAQVDAVMVGAATLRAEKLSLGLDSGPGITQPLAIILTAGGDIPLRDNLVVHESQDVLVITTKEKAGTLSEGLEGRAKVLCVPEAKGGYPDLKHALRPLSREYGIRRLLVEGGPRLNQALVSRGLIDELFLTLAPKLLGGTHGDPQTIIEGYLPSTVALRLLSVHTSGDELFLRYSLPSSPG